VKRSVFFQLLMACIVGTMCSNLIASQVATSKYLSEFTHVVQQPDGLAQTLRQFDSIPARVVFAKGELLRQVCIERDADIGQTDSTVEAVSVLACLSDTVIVNAETMPQLYEDLVRVSRKLSISVPLVCVIDLPGIVNAFSFKNYTSDISNGCVFLTTGLLQHLSDRAILAVLAHEMGHLMKNHSPQRLQWFLLSVLAITVVSLSTYSGVWWALSRDYTYGGDGWIKYGAKYGAAYMAAGIVGSGLGYFLINKFMAMMRMQEREADGVAREWDALGGVEAMRALKAYTDSQGSWFEAVCARLDARLERYPNTLAIVKKGAQVIHEATAKNVEEESSHPLFDERIKFFSQVATIVK